MIPTYKQVKEMLKHMGFDLRINPIGPGYVLSLQRENIVYGPWRARNLTEAIRLAMDLDFNLIGKEVE